MKAVLLLVIASLTCSIKADQVMDFLVDEWLSHARQMMKATDNGVYTTPGMEFYTKCGAFITSANCTVTADVGMISDLTTLSRASPVRITSSDDYTSLIQFSLAYDDLRAHFPNMIIQGEGINIIYRGIDTTTSNSIPFSLQMTLDYTNGADQCTNFFQITHSAPSYFQVKTTIQTPPAVLPLNNDLTQNIMDSILDAATSHISTLVNYEKICTKLAHLF